MPYLNNNMDQESDYPIYQLARTLQLHQGFGPMPSAQMILHDILQATSIMGSHNLYVQRPLNVGLTQFPMVHHYERLLGKQPCPNILHDSLLPFYDADSDQEQVNPNWGNNWEASSSSSPAPPVCFERMVPSVPASLTHVAFIHPQQLQSEQAANMDLDLFIPVHQSEMYHPGNIDDVQLDGLQDEHVYSQIQLSASHLQMIPYPEIENPQPIQTVMPTPPKKRKTRKRLTYIVDDEIQRNTRQHQCQVLNTWS